jgi:hypothetical protein
VCNSRILYVSSAVGASRVVRGVSSITVPEACDMWSAVPLVPGHQGQPSVSRLLHWCTCCGVTILLRNISQAIYPSLLRTGW